MRVNLMRGTDLVEETRAALRRVVDEVGGTACGAVMFFPFPPGRGPRQATATR
jgi:hypothetical protein